MSRTKCSAQGRKSLGQKLQSNDKNFNDTPAFPASLNASDPEKVKLSSKGSISARADATQILETERVRALDVYVKRYLKLICLFQDGSALTTLDELLLSYDINLSLAHLPLNTHLETFKTNADYVLLTTQDMVDLLKFCSEFKTIRSIGTCSVLCSNFLN